LTVSLFGCIVFFAKSWEDAMSSFHDDLSGFGSINSSNGHNPFSPILEAPVGLGLTAVNGPGGGDAPVSGHAPKPTLITGFGSNLAIDLIWDSSVSDAPKGFTAAVDSVAELLVSVLHTTARTVLYIDVGWGELLGGPVPGLAASASQFWYEDTGSVIGALAAHGDDMTAASGAALGPDLFFTQAEGKALGLLPGTFGDATHIDGAIGFSDLTGTGYSWQLSATGTGLKQFNLQAAALHELTEVMGRVAFGGTSGLYAPLDLFDFTAPGVLSQSNMGGYFSINNGATQMGQFNDAKDNGGDVGDWAIVYSVADSQTLPPGLQDPFDAAFIPGYDFTPSLDDLLVMQALGY
jgi:hypothetical protein